MRRTLSWMLLIAASLPVLAGGYYKWTDERGDTHFSDKPPPSLPKAGYDILNGQGMVIRHVDGLLTPAQRAAQEAAAAKAQSEQAQQEEARRHDRALINSFSNTGEIDALRQRNVEATQASITSDQLRRTIVQHNIDRSLADVDALTKSKRPVPDDLSSSLSDQRAELAKIDADIAAKTDQIKQINERADADKKRLVQLLGPSAQK